MERYISTYDEFTVGGTKSNRILIFDIDDTLLYSAAKVYVVKNDKVVHELSSSEFNDYVLQDGEHFDFSEFDDLSILLKSTTTPYLDTLKREYAKGTHISILTARGNKQMIKQYFLTNGIDIKDEILFTVGDMKTSKTVAQRKADCIKKLIKYGYKTLVFFDDNEANLLEAEEICTKYNVRIITVHVGN